MNETLAESGIVVAAEAYGRGGAGVEDSIADLRRLVASIKPDLVIALLGVNDITWRRARDAARTDHSAGADDECDENRSMDSRCPSFLQLCRRLRLAAEALAAPPATGTSIEWHSKNLPTIRERFQRMSLVDAPPPEESDLVKGFSQSVEELVSISSQAGADVLLLGQPVLWKDGLSAEETGRLWFPVATKDGFVRASPAWLEREMHRFNEAQRAVAERHRGTFWVDLEGSIPKDLEHFFDDCHFTDRGSHRVAAIIGPMVLDRVRARSMRPLRAEDAEQ